MKSINIKSKLDFQERLIKLKSLTDISKNEYMQAETIEQQVLAFNDIWSCPYVQLFLDFASIPNVCEVVRSPAVESLFTGEVIETRPTTIETVTLHSDNRIKTIEVLLLHIRKAFVIYRRFISLIAERYTLSLNIDDLSDELDTAIQLFESVCTMFDMVALIESLFDSDMD